MIPLSPEATAAEAAVLGVPVTLEAMDDVLPEGLTGDEIERLYHGALSGANWVVPELKKAIKRFPGYPTLKNYLVVAYQGRGQERQARGVQEEIVTLHPEYLFGRIGAASQWIEAGKPENARAALGGDLDLSKLYPDRDLFHITEVKNFYASAAAIHFHTGEFDKGLGIQSALAKLVPDDPSLDFVQNHLMQANAKRWQDMFAEDEKQRIEVKCPSLSKAPSSEPDPPAFQHPEIELLYEYDLDFPDSLIREILALPRETLVADLTNVLRDGLASTPWFLNSGDDGASSFFPFHSIYLLGELAATEALPAVLDFHALPPKALDFWLGDFSHSAPLAAICAGDLPQVAAWLKFPGISSVGKSALVSALVFLARKRPETRTEVLSIFRETLEFILASPPADNVVDTALVSFIVGDLMTLRAAELRPLIERLWEKRYILRSVTGDLEAILKEIASPPAKARSQPEDGSMIASYRDFQKIVKQPHAPEPVRDFEPLGNDLYGFTDPGELPPADVGRNDPCPCGSGKKYKKCCLGK
ncbi:MAG: SEC-C metal-binding domain-containing protein [Luteolibacter sp.]